MVIADHDLQTDSDLMQIIDALDALRARLGAGQRWQQKPRKNSDNRHNDQQFDQCKATSICFSHYDLDNERRQRSRDGEHIFQPMFKNCGLANL